MAGQARADQGCSRFRYDPHRRIACLFKDGPIAFPVCLLPACRTADVDNIVIFLHQVSAADQLGKNTRREGPDILRTRRIAQKTALKTNSAGDGIRAVACALTDQQSAVDKTRVRCDEALCSAHRHNLRLLTARVRLCHRYSALRVSQIKSIVSFHLLLPQIYRIRPSLPA